MTNNMSFEALFMYFFIYSVLGWICEMIYCGIYSKKITNRGFLSGPYCPIYGTGGLIIVLFLTPFIKHPFLVFILGMIFTSVLEYITSFLMEKAFNAKWWDYSHYRFNIHGRVCLLNSTLFGIGSLVIVYFINPYVEKFINKIPAQILNPVSIFLMFVITIDFIGTLNTILGIKDKLKTIKDIGELIELYKENSQTKKELEKLKENIIAKTTIFNKRIINSFPNLDFTKHSKDFEEFKLAIKKKQNEIKLAKQKIKNKK